MQYRTIFSQYQILAQLLTASSKHWNLRWIYCTTSSVRPCLDIVVRTSAAPFLHWMLWVGHQLLMALKSKFKSSSLASSSADAGYWQSLFNNWKTMEGKAVHHCWARGKYDEWTNVSNDGTGKLLRKEEIIASLAKKCGKDRNRCGRACQSWKQVSLQKTCKESSGYRTLKGNVISPCQLTPSSPLEQTSAKKHELILAFIHPWKKPSEF